MPGRGSICRKRRISLIVTTRRCHHSQSKLVGALGPAPAPTTRVNSRPGFYRLVGGFSDGIAGSRAVTLLYATIAVQANGVVLLVVLGEVWSKVYCKYHLAAGHMSLYSPFASITATDPAPSIHSRALLIPIRFSLVGVFILLPATVVLRIGRDEIMWRWGSRIMSCVRGRLGGS